MKIQIKKTCLAAVMLLVGSACEMATWQYGYYWNPIQCLEQALEAVQKQDVPMLNEVLMNGAMTQFGDEEGIAKIQQHLDAAQIKTAADGTLVGPTLKSTTQANGKKTEIYSAQILKNNRTVIRTTFTCEHWDDRGERHACGISSIELL